MQNTKPLSRVEHQLARLLATTPPPDAVATLQKVDLFYQGDSDPGLLTSSPSK